jgi:DNA-binding IclR family transcriptional regulator
MNTERDRQTSLEKALDVCEALAGSQRGLSVTELGKSLKLPAPTVHRLLAVLKRRGFVRQDEESSRYSLTLKMLDLSFRQLGRSELRLHAIRCCANTSSGPGPALSWPSPPVAK